MKKILILLICIISFSLLSCEEKHEHAFAEMYITDEDAHYLQCSCGEKSQYAKHDGGHATCISKAICQVCGQQYGNLLEHDYTILDYDGENHFYKCSCNDVENVEAHSFSTGVITKRETDKECGVISYKCDGCDYVKEVEIPKIEGHEVSIYPSLSNADIVSYEGKIYTYGGSPDGSGRTNSIYCFDTYTNKLYKLSVKLKKESTSHRAILVEDKVYIFGGLNRNGKLDYILVHDLKNQTIEELDVKMPFGANCFQVGYYQNKVYIVGGALSTGNSNMIYEFDVKTKEFKLIDANIPKKVFKGGWCSVGKYMYLIGGTDGKRLNTIYRFDMELHIVEEMDGKLVDYISQSRAVYDGNGNIYIYGGTNENNQLLNYVQKYNIENDTCTLEEYSLPYNLANLCVTKTDNGIYILGGDNDTLNVILKHQDSSIINVKEVL